MERTAPVVLDAGAGIGGSAPLDALVDRLEVRTCADDELCARAGDADCVVVGGDGSEAVLSRLEAVREVAPELPVVVYAAAVAPDRALAAGATGFGAPPARAAASRLSARVRAAIADVDRSEATSADDAAPLDHRRQQRRLAGLNSLGQQLLSAADVAAVCDTVVDAATDALSLPATAVALFDDDANRLRVEAASPAAESLPLAECCEANDDVWEAFVTSRRRVTTVGEDGAGRRLVASPLGKFGVLLVAATDEFPVTAPTLEFVDAVAATLSSALDRADREQVLRRRETALQERNERLERVNRANELVRDVSTRLVGIADRETAYDRVCERLAGAGPYELAWVGSVDVVSGELTPEAAAGDDEGYLEAITVETGSGARAEGPGGTAVETRTAQVVDDTLSDPPFEPWRRAALNRGYRSVIAVPLTYEGTLYGVLFVYDDEPASFDELSRSVLTDIGEALQRTVHRIERDRGHASSERIELVFELGEVAPLTAVARAVGGTVRLEGVVDAGSGQPRSYYTVDGADAAAVREEVHAIPGRDVNVADDEGRDPGALVEATATSESFVARVVDHGGRVDAMEATPTDTTATVSLPATADVRQFVESVQRWAPGSELSAKRRHDEPFRSARDVTTELDDRLTDRQREVLETAFRSGYFESPREFTGGEIAATIGISQPTFHSHLRNAQRTLLDLLLNSEDAPSIGLGGEPRD